MRWTDYLSLAGSALAAVSLLRLRNWLVAAGFACQAAYVLFDKWFPTALPPHPDVLFPAAGLCLIMAQIVRSRKRRNPPPQVPM
jgi:hypothetical protein